MDCRKIEKFLSRHLKFPHPLLEELYRLALEEKFPVVEPSVGNLIYFFVKLLRAKVIVEFGSGFGYSALWAALACDWNCTVHCIDYQEKNRKRAMEIFKRLGVSEKIRYHVGEAETIFSQLGFEDESIDLVLFDHEKQNYSGSLDLVLPKLKRGGVIIADDVLWRGEVADPSRENLRLSSLRFFLKEISQRGDLVSFVCPLGDGVAVIQKL